MFSASILASVAAVCLSALTAEAAPGLTLKVSGPSSVDGVDNLKVVATLVNTGDETLKLLNDPRGALSKLPTNSFAISSDAGVAPSFTGIKAKYVPSQAIASDDPSAFTILAPGASIDIEHDLSEAYNFTLPGAGEYTIEASNLFTYVDPVTKAAVPIYAKANAHSAKVAGKLAIARRAEPKLSKRITYSSCTSAQQTSIASAVTSAASYASAALTYLNAHTATTTRYSTWFGTYTAARHTTVTSHYSKISSAGFSTFTYDCSCTTANTYAYVYPGTFGKIYLCGAFWNAPTTGTDSKAGTLVHESSHFTANGGTSDNVYGQSGAKALAISNPASAILNADSHEYFAENNPTLA